MYSLDLPRIHKLMAFFYQMHRYFSMGDKYTESELKYKHTKEIFKQTTHEKQIEKEVNFRKLSSLTGRYKSGATSVEIVIATVSTSKNHSIKFATSLAQCEMSADVYAIVLTGEKTNELEHFNFKLGIIKQNATCHCCSVILTHKLV